MRKRAMFWTSLFLVLSWLAAAIIYYRLPKTQLNLPLYFHYTPANITYLSNLKTHGTITLKDFTDWDEIIFDLIREHQLNNAEAAKVFAYVYTAQRDAAFLAFNIHQKFTGNISNVTRQTLCLLFPQSCANFSVMPEDDLLSKQIGSMVMIKIKQRMSEEKRPQTFALPAQPGEPYWRGKIPYAEQDASTWKPWLIESAGSFKAPAPPAMNSTTMRSQIQTVKHAAENVTLRQQKAIINWSGVPGSITQVGEWIRIVNNAFIDNNLPLKKFLLYRSLFAMTLADTTIAANYSKYFYWVKRPYMVIPSLYTIMPTPNSPSYPSENSAIACAATTALSYYFPQNIPSWQILVNEVRQTGIWSGIYFPIDDAAGCDMGAKIATTIIHKRL